LVISDLSPSLFPNIALTFTGTAESIPAIAAPQKSHKKMISSTLYFFICSNAITKLCALS